MHNQASRTILITGASRGLGLAMTERFIELGHTVIGCARSPSSVTELLDRFPSPHHFDTLSTAHNREVEEWSERVLADYGPPDLLLNNAALMNESAPLWEVSPVEFSELTATNINGVFHLIRHFLPAMIERGSGVVVNFSSGWGRSTSPDVAPYCATKWAIEGLTRALADELPPGLAAIPLNPGIINTEMLESCFGTAAASYPGPEEWARRAVPFLLELGPEHNGQPLTVPS